MGSDAATLQRRVFYNTNWTVEMEKTFMDTLVDQIASVLMSQVTQILIPYAMQCAKPIENTVCLSIMVFMNPELYVNLPDPSWESMVIVFRDPIREDSEDDEHNIHNHGNGNGNDEMDVNNLSPPSDNNSDN
ncbi:hypothetical protein Salat_2428800 [Sesamum alatum]|uniref:Uncharacterized protein n=1 Tax=Sesamum alatum TaxID=300844 RepID=A0AAE1XY82_9LAMI|nr:hypothetical protein Salat_2428800 [Sesamum alatum]